MRGDIRKMILENKVCALATVSGDVPHCSLMSYAVDEDGRKLYMATLQDTKKYRNLAANPHVSVLIDTRDSEGKGNTRALTISGVFEDPAGDPKQTEIREILIARHPDLKDFFNSPDARIIVIRVTAVQLLDGVTDAYFEKV
jgi:nitroimidazol reductase NimA-like FMN-containing flavoprotein (pyridoxamine 5'-phosphate oxidase superfamily)